MKKLIILSLIIFPFSLSAQKVNGVYSRSAIETQIPTQCTACLVQEGDSVSLFVRNDNSTAIPGPDVIVNTFSEKRFIRAKLAGAINLGNSNYYTKAQLDPTLNNKVNIGSIGSNSIAMYAESNKSIYSSNIFNANGKIGINTTNPTHQLHVNGNARFRDIRSWMRHDIEGAQIGGDENWNLAGITFGNWMNPTGSVPNITGGSVGDWNMDDPYMYLRGRKGVAISTGGDNFGNTVGIFVDTLRKVGFGTFSPLTKVHTYGANDEWIFMASSTNGVPGIDGSIRITGRNTTFGAPTIQARSADGSVYRALVLDAAAMNIKIQGTERFSVDQYGNVGINVSNPSVPLDVNGIFRTRTDTWLANFSGRVGVRRTSPLYMMDVNGSLRADSSAFFATELNTGVVIGSTTYDGFKLDVGGWVRTKANTFVATESGSLAVGTTTPSADKLNVVGTTLLDGTTTLSSYLNLPVVGSGAVASRGVAFQGNEYVIGYGTEGVAGSNIIGPVYSKVDYAQYSYRWGKHTGASLLADGSNFTTQMVLTNTGGLGVGTSSPSGKLEIAGMSGGIGLRINRDVDNILDIYQGGGITYFDASTPTGQINFSTNGASRARITNAGNFGINTDTPGAKFEVKSSDAEIVRVNTVNTSQQGYIGFAEQGSLKQVFGKNTDNTFFLYDAVAGRDILKTNTSGNLTLVPSAGRVGIGTPSPDATLHVNGAVIFTPMAAASVPTAIEGMIVCVNTTNVTFTSTGFWGYYGGTWVKMSN